MRALAAFIMRGRMQAVMVAAVCTILSAIVAPLSYLGSGAIGLVTLRLGAAQGSVVMVGAALAAGILSLLTVHTAVPVAALAVMLWLPVWALALLLRRTASQGAALGVAAGLAALGVITVHLVLGTPVAWWQKVLEQAVAPVLERRGVTLAPGAMHQAALMMTGMLAAATVLGVAISLFLARWWQSLLYNPGGFGGEFRSIRLDRRIAVVTLLAVLVAVAGGQTLRPLGVDLVLVAVVLYMLQGLALAHALVRTRGASVGWLVALYLALVFLWPYAMLAVATAGLADAWMDFRSQSARS